MQYTAICGSIAILVSTDTDMPNIVISDHTKSGARIRIDAQDATTIRLLRQALSHIVDTYKHKEA